MVILDTTTLLFLFHPDAKAPIDDASGLPVTDCKERVETLLGKLTESQVRVLIPTPVLSEILVAAGPRKQQILQEVSKSSRFTIEPFDELAAIEVACLTDGDPTWSHGTTDLAQTKAKIKYDRQIIATAKVHGVDTIYSDDGGLAKCAKRNGIKVVKTVELPLANKPSQVELPLPPAPDLAEPQGIRNSTAESAPENAQALQFSQDANTGVESKPHEPDLVGATHSEQAPQARAAQPAGTLESKKEANPSAEAPVVRSQERPKPKSIGPLH